MVAEEIFVKISITILLAVVISGIMRFLKQPLLIGYIITGILVGPYFFGLLGSNEVIDLFSELGVALLLFTVGLGLNPRVIREVGKISLITGVGQVLFTSIIGFMAARFLLGFEVLISVYVAIALAFSSTIIIMKLITDKEDSESVYGKIAIGFLIVQDLIAIFILMAVSSITGEGSVVNNVVQALVSGAIAITALFLFSYLVLPKLTRKVAKSQEYLFLFSIGWCLAIASVFATINLSLEIGALLAGVSLSISPYSKEIGSKMRPLRDFFIVLFFIVIGSEMMIGDIGANIVPIVALSAFVLIGNPLIVMTLMGIFGYTKRTAFMAGLTVAQISEFSLILISLGIGVGHLPEEILSLVTGVALITIAGSTYTIIYSDKIYPLISRYLSVFERKNLKEKRHFKKKVDAILFGYNRIGFGVLKSLKDIKKSYLVVDYNPDTITDLKKYGVPAMYGDVYDTEFLEDLPLRKMKMAISTIPDFSTNVILIDAIRRVNKKAIIIVRSHSINEALELYNSGADYVLTPHFLGGEYISKMIEHTKIKEEGYEKERKKHIKLLKEIQKRGHEHPRVEKD